MDDDATTGPRETFDTPGADFVREIIDATDGDPEAVEVHRVNLDSIDPTPAGLTNYRKEADASGLHQLAQTIRQDGLLQPITIRPAKAGPLPYELVLGWRRYHAVQLLGWTIIEAIIRDLSDDDVRRVRVIENVQREDVSPLDESDAFVEMLAWTHANGATWTPQDVADRVGRPLRYVSERLKLRDLGKDARKQLGAGVISMGHALALCRVGEAAQEQAITALFYAQQWKPGGGYVRGKQQIERSRYPSVAMVEDYIERSVLLDLSRAIFDVADPTLVPRCGACTTCTRRTGAMPELFSAAVIKRGDMCLDETCFREKTAAHIDNQIAAVQALEVPGMAVFLGDEYNNVPKDIAERYHPTKSNKLHILDAKEKPCEHETVGVVVGGAYRQDTVGTRVRVCTKERCDVHGTTFNKTNGGRPAPQKLSDDERKKREQQMDDAERRERIGRAIVERATKTKPPLPPEAMQGVVWRFFDRTWHEHQKAVIQLLGWAPPPPTKEQREKAKADRKAGKIVSNYVDYSAIFARQVAEKPANAMAALAALTIIAEVERGNTDGYHDVKHRPKNIMATLAKLYDVDTKAIADAVAAERKVKNKERAEKEKRTAERKAKEAAREKAKAKAAKTEKPAKAKAKGRKGKVAA